MIKIIIYKYFEKILFLFFPTNYFFKVYKMPPHIKENSEAVNNGNDNRYDNHLYQGELGFGTKAIHIGQDPDPNTGAVIPPISLSTTYKQSAIEVHQVR